MKLETKNNIEKYFGGDGKKADEITDTKSKEYFIEWLSENGVKPENIFPTGDFSHIDIVAQTKRGLYGFELKKRRCPSGRYPDAIIDGKKYDQIITAADNFKRGTGEDIKTFVVSFYNDGKMYIWNMEIVKCVTHIYAHMDRKYIGSERLDRPAVHQQGGQNARERNGNETG